MVFLPSMVTTLCVYPLDQADLGRLLAVAYVSMMTQAMLILMEKSSLLEITIGLFTTLKRKQKVVHHT